MGRAFASSVPCSVRARSSPVGASDEAHARSPSIGSRTALARGALARGALARAACGAAAALVLVAAVPASADELYRWLDARGGVHFGSVPPPGARSIRKVEPGAADARITIAPALDAAPAPASSGDPAPRAHDPRATLEALEAAEPTAIAGRSESQWRERALALKAKIEKAEAELDYAEDQLSSSYGLRSSAYYQRRVDRAKASLASARDAFERFEDNARQLGVPPGWLR